MALFLIGLILFLGLHLIRLFPGIRDGLIGSLGKIGFRAVFSVAAIATLCLLIYGFGQARMETDILYTPPPFMAHLTLLLMLLASIVLVSGFLPSGYIATWTKNPPVLAIKIWALAHLFANGEVVQVILFAAFLAWGVILRISYKKRVQRGEVAPRVYKSWTWDVAAVAIGVVLYGVFAAKLHPLLIGVPALPM
ncbi:NnrU family protein [Rhizobium sp. KVB221]|uniref:NnrU family protein n=1 Tax=Rhizobium setariae TaxID=2801340 RepID=A0A937CNL1_9HYPH|nr:NnrU family protein [Rhizobium setariae]MBL0372099.1 NnrU family protein [Rhizobium setariae]